MLSNDDDGYHDIQGIFHIIDLHDTIIFKKNDNNNINLHTTDKNLMSNDNLICRACRMLSQKYNLKIGIDITLEKKIPLGSGLGGGSSNAAVTLLAINRLYIFIYRRWVAGSCGSIRSDGTFFINGGTAYVSGKGNIEKAPSNPNFMYQFSRH